MNRFWGYRLCVCECVSVPEPAHKCIGSHLSQWFMWNTKKNRKKSSVTHCCVSFHPSHLGAWSIISSILYNSTKCKYSCVCFSFLLRSWKRDKNAFFDKISFSVRWPRLDSVDDVRMCERKRSRQMWMLSLVMQKDVRHHCGWFAIYSIFGFFCYFFSTSVRLLSTLDSYANCVAVQSR